MSPAEFSAFVGEMCATLDRGGLVNAQRPQTELDAAQARNRRRNLNLAMIELMQGGKAFTSPEVQALRAELAELPV